MLLMNADRLTESALQMVASSQQIAKAAQPSDHYPRPLSDGPSCRY